MAHRSSVVPPLKIKLSIYFLPVNLLPPEQLCEDYLPPSDSAERYCNQNIAKILCDTDIFHGGHILPVFKFCFAVQIQEI